MAQHGEGIGKGIGLGLDAHEHHHGVNAFVFKPGVVDQRRLEVLRGVTQVRNERGVAADHVVPGFGLPVQLGWLGGAQFGDPHARLLQFSRIVCRLAAVDLALVGAGFLAASCKTLRSGSDKVSQTFC